MFLDKSFDREGHRFEWKEQLRNYGEVKRLFDRASIKPEDMLHCSRPVVNEQRDTGKVVVEYDDAFRIIFEYYVEDASDRQKIYRGQYVYQEMADVNYIVVYSIKALDEIWYDHLERAFDEGRDISGLIESFNWWGSNYDEWWAEHRNVEVETFIQDNPDEFDGAVKRAKGRRFKREGSRLVDED